MGDDMETLESYFSAVICADIPNSRGSVTDEDGRVWDGAEAYRVQMEKLRLLLASLVRQRTEARDAAQAGSTASADGAQRLITSRHGLWFAMLPRIVRAINAGDAVRGCHGCAALSARRGRPSLLTSPHTLNCAAPPPPLSHAGARLPLGGHGLGGLRGGGCGQPG